MWQEITITIIGLIVVGILLRKVICFFTVSRHSNKCSNCSGCALKESMKDKQKKRQ